MKGKEQVGGGFGLNQVYLNDSLALLGFLAGDQLEEEIHEGRSADVGKNLVDRIILGLNESDGLWKGRNEDEMKDYPIFFCQAFFIVVLFQRKSAVYLEGLLLEQNSDHPAKVASLDGINWVGGIEEPPKICQEGVVANQGLADCQNLAAEDFSGQTRISLWPQRIG